MTDEKETRNRTSANGEGSCRYIESKKLWCCRITVGFDSNNKQIRKAFYGKGKKEAHDKGLAAQARMMNGQAAVSSNIKVEDWADKWVDDYKSSLSPRTIDQYKGVVKNQIKPAIGKYTLKDLKQAHIQRMLNDLLKKDYSPSIIKHTKQFTHEMLECAVDNDLLIQNPARKIKMPSMPKTKNEHEAFTPEEEQQLIDFMSSYLTQIKPHVPHKIGKAIIVLFKSGMRQEELLALVWHDIDFKANTIYIHQVVSLKKSQPYIKSTTKTVTSTRTIPMHPLVKQILLELSEKGDKRQTAFCNDKGGIWAPNCFYRLYKNYIEALNKKFEDEGAENRITYHSPHATRHTFATDLNRAGVDPKTIAALLGHAHADISMDVYTHTDDTAKLSAINSI